MARKKEDENGPNERNGSESQRTANWWQPEKIRLILHIDCCCKYSDAACYYLLFSTTSHHHHHQEHQQQKHFQYFSFGAGDWTVVVLILIIKWLIITLRSGWTQTSSPSFLTKSNFCRNLLSSPSLPWFDLQRLPNDTNRLWTYTTCCNIYGNEDIN